MDTKRGSRFLGLNASFVWFLKGHVSVFYIKMGIITIYMF